MSAKITSTKGSITRRVSAQAGSNFCAEFHFRREMFTWAEKKPQGTKTQYMNVDPRVSLLPLFYGLYMTPLLKLSSDECEDHFY